MSYFLSGITVISIGLMIGVELSVWAFINPILWKLEVHARSQAVRLFAQKLGAVMPFWYAGNFVLLIVEAAAVRRQPATWLLAAAAGIWAAVIVLTLIFLVPINNRLARPEPGFSHENAHREHVRWDARHRARVVALGAALVLLLMGLHV
ncbi:MAG TPA: anthrone oxygenase family protein [Terracidiphilus sp.]|nr:anthrone oxygenase family protein [Terracidiphilus sp.]